MVTVLCSVPGPIEFIEADLSSLPSLPATTPDSEKRDFPAIDKPKNEKVGGRKIQILSIESIVNADFLRMIWFGRHASLLT